MNLEHYNSIPFESFNWHDWDHHGCSNIIDNIDEFNTVLEFIYDNHFYEKTLTLRGHLSKRGPLGNCFAWSATPSTNTMEIIVIFNGNLYKFTFWPGRKDETLKVSGSTALKKFRDEAGHLVKEFALTRNEDVAEVKKLIEKPKIELKFAPNFELVSDEDWTFFHLDLNSAFPAGIVATTPVLKDYFTELFNRRHEDPEAKLLLNAGIGAMQSLKLWGRRYPELSRRAIAWTNAELSRQAEELRAQNCTILAFNTDGIWAGVRGKISDLHLSNVGSGLGQWKIDHVVEKIRFKSRGAYEYIENGKYYAVIRGRTKLDAIKPREEWQWGDIYHNDAYLIAYQYDNLTGYVKEVTITDGEEEEN